MFENRLVFIDATVFMGMHSRFDAIRLQSLSIMSENFGQCIHMSLEQVGLCDDIVWKYPRHIQDNYYPFMDCLHSEMDIQRIPYCRSDLLVASELLEGSDRLSPCQALVLAQVINSNGVLATHDPLLKRARIDQEFLLKFPVVTEPEKVGELGKSQLFNDDIDCLYSRSRCLVHE